MRILYTGLLLVFCVLLGVSDAQAEKRIALVVGNSAYKNAPLTNPKNDASLMADTLREVGFQVTTLLDADYRTMKRALVDFGRKLRTTDTVGLFYYAGHGVQVAGNNYLVPIDEEIKDESEVGVYAINVNEYLQTMKRASSRINIVVLDACRNNPYANSFRSTSRGLARVDAPTGTYIAYATSPGKVAFDGDGENSPYTAALAEAIETPGLTLEETFKRARRTVLAATNDQQTPWENSSITGRFYFKAPALSGAASADDAAWAIAKNTTDATVLETYLATYPNGRYVGDARQKLARLTLEKSAKAVVVEPAEQSKSKLIDPSIKETRALTLKIQQRLTDLGCAPGPVDGLWGTNSRRALEVFSRQSKNKLASLDPSQNVLDALNAPQAPKCPLTCSPRHTLEAGTCVLKTCASGETLSEAGTCVASAPKQSSRTTQKKKCGDCLNSWGNVYRYCGPRYERYKKRGWCNN